MPRNVVFVSIFDLTRVFYEMAVALTERGHRVSWITTNELWTDWLKRQGVAEHDILQLVYDRSAFVGEDEKARLVPEIVAAEANSDLTVNQSLIMDRFVIFKNKPDINEYMFLYYRDIKRFLQEKQADIVFAEPTNCNEMMTHIVCGELSVPLVAPWDMRYPARRTIFCPGYDQATLAVADESTEVEPETGHQLIDDFAARQERPFSFKKFNEQKIIDSRKAARVTANRLRLLHPSSRRHLTHHDFSERLRNALGRIVNGFYMRHICRHDQLDNIPGKLAFYPLHVQPESSIDVQGSFFSDQLKLIKDIRRSLPFDMTLVIKEHPNFLGQRGPSFFRQLRRIPNVKLVPYSMSTFDIYRRTAIVFTVTGTAAYEAGLLGIPAVTFAPMYFGGFSTIRHCGDVTRLKEVVFDLIQDRRRDRANDDRFMAQLMMQSHEGYWTDPLFDPAVMADENIQCLQKAFVRIVESQWVGKKGQDSKTAEHR